MEESQKYKGRIKKRNLDPEVLDVVNHAAIVGNIQLTDLTPVLQNAINKAINSGNTGGYDDSILKSQLTDLDKKKADRTDLNNCFDITHDHIGFSLLDAAVNAKLASIQNIDVSQFRLKTDTILESELDNSFRTKVANIGKEVEAVKASCDLTPVNAEIIKVKKSIADETAQESTDKAELQKNIDTVQKNVDINTAGIASIETTIKNSMPSVDHKITEDILGDSIVAKLAKTSKMDDFDSLKMTVDSLVASMVVYSSDKYTIKANSFIEVVFTTDPAPIYVKILMLDADTSSRTKDTYINSEGCITTSYKDKSIIIYNDTNADASIKLITNYMAVDRNSGTPSDTRKGSDSSSTSDSDTGTTTNTSGTSSGSTTTPTTSGTDTSKTGA